VKKKENISNKDKQSWEEYIKNPKDIFDKEKNKVNISSGKQRYKFDLHGFSLVEANSQVEKIISFCLEKNYKEILLITGKGIHSNVDKDVFVSSDLSKLRYSIPEFINTNAQLKNKIINIYPAEIEDGGEGALIIKLKKL
jgi:DNA-nicking Smr family endonuclease|tara:strand:+ start:1755 stop:2174 length:420 start_codon:yes stop_codon:yes gene_type:complete